MSNNKEWGYTRITYRIMTDENGVKWKVPTEIDGQPFEYLRKYDPEEHLGSFERIEICQNPQ